jgi:hypothetical protein
MENLEMEVGELYEYVRPIRSCIWSEIRLIGKIKKGDLFVVLKIDSYKEYGMVTILMAGSGLIGEIVLDPGEFQKKIK